MRIVFAGSNDFSLFFLKKLVLLKKKIVGILVKKNVKSKENKLILFAINKNIPLFQAEKSHYSLLKKWIISLKIDLLIVASYGLIFPKKILEIIPLSINLHSSLLPRWRGPAPIQRALFFGDKKIGFSIIKIDKNIDSGPILHQVSINILKDDTFKTLNNKLQKIGWLSLLKVLYQIQKKSLCFKYQKEKYITYAYKILKKESQIDWYLTSKQIECCIKAFNPYPVSYFIVENFYVKVWYAYSINTNNFLNKLPGTIMSIQKNGIYVMTGYGIIVLTVIQISGNTIRSSLETYNAKYKWLYVNNILQ